MAGICLIAVLLALFSQWYHHHQSSRSLAHFGPDAAMLILRAKKVELLRLQAPPELRAKKRQNVRELTILGQRRQIAGRREISTAQGLIHARTSLCQDSSFRWDQKPSDCQPQWNFALQFSQGKSMTTLAFALNCQLAAHVEQSTLISIEPIAQGMADFVKSLPAK